MNRTYSLVWNHCLGAWSVTSEHARRRSKGAGAVLAAALLLPTFSMAANLPSAGQVVSGSGSIQTPSGTQMVIQQNSNKLALDWQSFDIAAGHKVTFNQPNAKAVALNRVLGSDGSKIMGQLDANGQVFIVNPNGVVFGKQAQVDVGGLVASSLDLSVKDFEAGNYQFKGDGNNAGVLNQGTLKAKEGGAVALLGGTVSNQGVIVAKQGTVALAAGNKVTLDFAGDGLLNLQVDEGTAHALVENRQLIQADGGQVLLTAAAADALVKAVVNNDGVIQAQSLAEKDGKILLLADMQHGELNAAGTLEANFVETSAAQVNIDQGLKVKTQGGEWLIDPVDITIDQSKATAIENALGSGDVTVVTANGAGWAGVSNGTGNDAGDIHVNAAITYSQNTLTLNADNNININATINASGSAKLALEYGQGAVAAGNTADYHLNNGAQVNLPAGQNFSTKLGSDGPTKAYTVITQLGSAGSTSAADLQGISHVDNLNGNYVLGGDINAGATANWNNGLGFKPIGISSSSFSGIFDGLGHRVTGLTINRPDEDVVGLFGSTNGATLRNVGLQGGSVIAKYYVGGLVGISQGNDSISNTYNTGSVTSTGRNSTIGPGVGGLVGSLNGSLTNSYATGTVKGGVEGASAYVGGLVGRSYGEITNSYATGTVSGGSIVGGLVGYHHSGVIRNAYATGSVTGNDEVGGLVGWNTGTIAYTYALGAVSGATNLGGLVGNSNISGSVGSSFYASTNVSGSAINTGSAFTGNVNGTAKNPQQFTQLATFNGWNIDTQSGTEKVWRLYEGNTTPLLRSFLKPLTVTADSSSLANKTYDRLIAQGIFTYTTNIAGAQLSGTARYASNWFNAGNYSMAAGNLTLGGLYSGQQGYDISYSPIGASLNINKKPLTLTGATVSTRQYNGTVMANLSGGTISGILAQDQSNLTVTTGTFQSKNVGNAIPVTPIVTGSAGSNYTFTAPMLTGNITPRPLTITGVTAYKVYDGTVTATLSGGILQGLVTGENLTLTVGIGEFLDADVGTAKAFMVSGFSISNDSGLASNYSLAQPTTVTAEISRKDLMITANDVSKTYDGLAYNGSAGVSYNGFVNGETYAVLGGALSYSSGVNAGTHAINASGLTSDNYVISYVPGTLLINKAALTVTANNASKTYDGLAYNGSSGVRYSGFVNGQTDAVLDGALGYSSGVNAGTHTINASGFSSGNYVFSYVPGTLLINKTALTVTANDASKTYDGLAYNGSSGVRYSGFVNGETYAVLDGALGYSSGVNAGTHTINASGFSSGNYVISYAPGTLLINQAALTVTANDVSKTYDGLDFSGGNGVSYDGFVNGESASVLVGSASYGGTAQGATNAGSYELSVNGFSSGNYLISYVPGTLLINQAALEVTVNDASKTYDGLLYNGSAGVSYNGFVNGETYAVLGGALGYSSGVNAGTHTINASGFSSGNYVISYVPGTLLINKAALTVTANDASKTYDGLAFNGGNGVSYVGFVNGENSSVLGGSASYGGTAQGATNAGSYALSVSGFSSDNYMISYVPGTLLINKAAITVSGIHANNKTYDGTTTASLSFGDVSFTGMVAGDSLNVTTANASFSDKNAGTAKQVNIIGITLGGADAGNYELISSSASTTADIARKALSISALDTRKPQGQVADLSYSVTGLVTGDSLSGVSLSSDGQGRAAPVGRYVISASDAQGGDLANYDISYQNATLEVEPSFSTDPAYIAALSTAVQLPERSATPNRPLAFDFTQGQPPQTLAFNQLPLSIENGGLRLPEGL